MQVVKLPTYPSSLMPISAHLRALLLAHHGDITTSVAARGWVSHPQVPPQVAAALIRRFHPDDSGVVGAWRRGGRRSAADVDALLAAFDPEQDRQLIVEVVRELVEGGVFPSPTVMRRHLSSWLPLALVVGAADAVSIDVASQALRMMLKHHGAFVWSDQMVLAFAKAPEVLLLEHLPAMVEHIAGFTQPFYSLQKITDAFVAGGHDTALRRLAELTRERYEGELPRDIYRALLPALLAEAAPGEEAAVWAGAHLQRDGYLAQIERSGRLPMHATRQQLAWDDKELQTILGWLCLDLPDDVAHIVRELAPRFTGALGELVEVARAVMAERQLT